MILEAERTSSESRDGRITHSVTETELPRIQPGSGPVAPETRRGRRIALTVVVIGTFALVAWVASPLWVGLCIGTVMAFTAQPMFRKLLRRLGSDRRGLAAAILTALSGVLALAVGALSVYLVTRELVGLVALLQRKMSSGTLGELVGERNARLVERAGIPRGEMMAKIHREMSHLAESAASAVGVVLQTTSGAVLGLIVALMTMYYVLIEWPNIALRIERVLPLDPRHTRALILEFRAVGRSSFVGTLATAVVQGVLGGVGYFIAGLSNTVTLAVATAIASFLPVVGTGLVWGGVAIYLALSGKLLAGIFVAVWGLLVVMALSDYVIRPRLVGGRSGRVHPLLTLIALLGGIEVFGLTGLILAPILMSLFLAALRIYERDLGGGVRS